MYCPSSLRLAIPVQARELAAADVPDQPSASQVVERAGGAAAEQAHRVPAQLGGARGPVIGRGHECLTVGHELLPPVERHIARCSGLIEAGNSPDPLQEDRVALQTVI
jgi:hypothetical protein